MAVLSGSVGKGGKNLAADVIMVQQLLNEHVASLGLPTLVVDGDNGPNTIEAIRRYQKLAVGIAAPDGRIDPGGRTWTALAARTAVGAPPLPPTNAALSGAAWWHANQAKYPNSNKLIDLVPPFRAKAVQFTGALAAAGARVSVSSTLRHRNRAYLMHFSWKIAKGMIAAGRVPPQPGVAIAWDHGNPPRSKRAAQEMVALFGMRFIAALNSNHIEGQAIDMTISWTGTLRIVDAGGRSHALGGPRNGAANRDLHDIGASYGVRKLVSDPPHWSDTGR
ncbi:MAG TPA: peptidoglycan-binding domain-containing protein [Allosphingosinicella sp.]|nr:peptidoglycan-binding domain-containing protein [Allosphingosinicella sp.]